MLKLLIGDLQCLAQSASLNFTGKYSISVTLELRDIQIRLRRRQWQPIPVLLPGKSHGWRSLVGCSPWGRKESDTTERLHFHFSLSCIGEGNGNPLQCSCLENPRDGRAWWAAICGVTESDTAEATKQQQHIRLSKGFLKSQVLSDQYMGHDTFFIKKKFSQGSPEKQKQQYINKYIYILYL